MVKLAIFPVRRLFVFLCAILLVGCGGTLSGAPEKLFDAKSELNDLRAYYGADLVNEYRSADGTKKRSLRNSIILGRMYAIDVAYGEYEKRLTTERQKIPFLATTTSIALSGTGILVGGEAVKSILAAVDTGLKGVRESYDKEVLLDKTIELLQQTMRANRNRVRSEIIVNLALPDDRYPLELAFSDIESYRAAGTLSSGIISATEATTKVLQETEEKRMATSFLETEFGADDYSEILRAYWRKNGTAVIKAHLDELGLQTTVSGFLSKKVYMEERRDLVKSLGLR